MNKEATKTFFQNYHKPDTDVIIATPTHGMWRGKATYNQPNDLK